MPPPNNAGQFLPKGINRTSQIVTTIIPAGQKFPIFQAGQRFYLVVATGEVTIKPSNGSENQYVQGTGLEVDDQNLFANLQITNENPFSVVIQIFVGFGTYIDNRLIVYDPTILQIAYPTSPVTATANQILIPDLSGQALQDANGNPFLALNRIAIYISNNAPADAYDLLNVAETKTLLTAYPLTDIVYPANGDFHMKIPAGNINATVSELYNAIRPAA